MHEPNDNQSSILRWEEHIVPILKHSDIHIRDKSLLAVAWESYARPSELHRLSFGDLEDRGNYVLLSLTGPDGCDRLLTLYGSMPYLKRWVQAEHPVTDLLAPDADPLEHAAPETPIWTQTQSTTQIPFTQLRAITKRACACANVPTEFTLHDIRRSRAILLDARLGPNASIFWEQFGWEPKIRTEFFETLEDDSFSEEFKPRHPIQCSDCGAWAPLHHPCLWCGTSR